MNRPAHQCRQSTLEHYVYQYPEFGGCIAHSNEFTKNVVLLWSHHPHQSANNRLPCQVMRRFLSNCLEHWQKRVLGNINGNQCSSGGYRPLKPRYLGLRRRQLQMHTSLWGCFCQSGWNPYSCNTLWLLAYCWNYRWYVLTLDPQTGSASFGMILAWKFACTHRHSHCLHQLIATYPVRQQPSLSRCSYSPSNSRSFSTFCTEACIDL